MFWKGSSFIVILFFVSCSRERNDFSSIDIIGHAGSGLENPSSIYHDNSKESIETALSRGGIEGVELDVQMAMDGSLWCYHDTHLDTETNGSGCIGEFDSSYLQTICYTTFNKEKLVRLLNISELKVRNKSVFLDLRHWNDCTQTSIDLDLMLLELIQFREIYNQTKVILVTNNVEWVSRLKSQGFMVYFEAEPTVLLENKILEYADGVVCKNRSTTKDQIREFHDLGKKVVLFEMRSPKGVNRALNKQPDGVMTDDIRVALIEKD